MKIIKAFVVSSVYFALFLPAVFAAGFSCHCDFTTPSNVFVKADKSFSDLKSIKGQLPCEYKDMHISLETDLSVEPTIHFIVHHGPIVKDTQYGKILAISSFRTKFKDGLREGFSATAQATCPASDDGAKCIHARVACEQK